MKERRKILIASGVSARFRFVNYILALVLLFSFINAFTSIKLLEEGKFTLRLDLAYIVSQLALVAIGLLLIVTLGYILHYGFGAISRMERMLDKVAKGDYSLRINLRKKDIMLPFADRINKLIDLLDKSSKNK